MSAPSQPHGEEKPPVLPRPHLPRAARHGPGLGRHSGGARIRNAPARRGRPAQLAAGARGQAPGRAARRIWQRRSGARPLPSPTALAAAAGTGSRRRARKRRPASLPFPPPPPFRLSPQGFQVEPTRFSGRVEVEVAGSARPDGPRAWKRGRPVSQEGRSTRSVVHTLTNPQAAIHRPWGASAHSAHRYY